MSLNHIPKAQIRPTEYMLDKTTILIVDDEAGPRESLKMILSPAHKVITCESAAEALEAMRASPVDLVTIDLQMPGMTGDELMRVIRQDHPSTEIIIITGNSSVQTAVEGLRFGISDYISKPFDVVEVSSAVSRALDRKQSRADLIDFLEGVGAVLGKDRDSGTLLHDVRTNPDLRARLYEALDPSAPTGGPRPDPQPESPHDDGDTATSALRLFNELHQLSGAIGFTREHPLHTWSMRLQVLRLLTKAHADKHACSR